MELTTESFSDALPTKDSHANQQIPAWRACIAGAAAGVTVDISLYPIDTLKTRLQSPVGFWKSGGFKGVYNGISAAASGSAPGIFTHIPHILAHSETFCIEST